MKILVVDLAQYGNEQTVLTIYGGNIGGGAAALAHGLDLRETAKQVIAFAQDVDYVCVDARALGFALIDLLREQGVKVLAGRALFSRKP